MIKKLIVLLIIMAFIGFMYFRNISKMKSISKMCEKIEDDPRIAENISDQLNKFLLEFNCDYNHVYDKLSRLKYELEVFEHRVYKCHQLNPNSFLLITTYEYLNTNSNNSVEKVIEIDYRFELDKSNKVKVFTNNDMSMTRFKNIFVKGFCKKYLNTDIEIPVTI